MMGGKKLETIQPKTGENHKLFGVRLLKQHNIREPKWVPGDKLVQYSGLARLYGKTYANLCIRYEISSYKFII